MIAPVLADRLAHCGMCHKNPQPSDPSLAFFEYRGPGSPLAADTCAHCGYTQGAHAPGGNRVPSRFICTQFEPVGAYDEDLYYCGCAGWD